MKRKNIELTRGPYITKSGEFTYGDSVAVRKEQKYFIDFTNSKQVEYRLAVNDEQMFRNKKLPRELYIDAIGSAKRDTYPTETFPTSKKLSFASKFINRIFAKNKLNSDSEIIEVEDVTNTPSYTFVTLNWQISGPESEVQLHNERQLNSAERAMPGISEKIPPLQLHEDKINQETSLESLVHKNPIYSGAIAPPPPPEQIRRKRIRKKRKKNRKKFKKGARVSVGKKIYWAFMI